MLVLVAVGLADGVFVDVDVSTRARVGARSMIVGVEVGRGVAVLGIGKAVSVGCAAV